jgi:hypothetical protein
LLDSIVEGLNELGEDMYKTISYHIKQKKGLSGDEFVTNIEMFLDGLEELFGGGSEVIEMLILERLASKVDVLKVFRETTSLADAVARCRFLSALPN